MGVGSAVGAVTGVTGIGDWVGSGDGRSVGIEVGTEVGMGMFEAAVGPSNTLGEPVAVGIGRGVLVAVGATWVTLVGSSLVCQQAVAPTDSMSRAQTIRLNVCLLHLRLKRDLHTLMAVARLPPAYHF